MLEALITELEVIEDPGQTHEIRAINAQGVVSGEEVGGRPRANA